MKFPEESIECCWVAAIEDCVEKVFVIVALSIMESPTSVLLDYQDMNMCKKEIIEMKYVMPLISCEYKLKPSIKKPSVYEMKPLTPLLDI